MEQIRRLPIGVQSFEKIRERGCVYVDKTQFIPLLLSTDAQYFLSRPRRFGKSLFISMLEEYFLGHLELFAGLALETQEAEMAKLQKRDAWIERPVFHLDLAGQIYNEKDSLENILFRHLEKWEKKFDIAENEKFSPADRFAVLIQTAYEKTGKQVVVLIDEYDKPLLDSIDNPELLDYYRTILKGFYGVLKPMDKYLHFVFITGITRFDKVSIFSDFNQLRDISVNEKFSAICGVTQKELENNFKPEIEAMAEKSGLTYDECLAKLKQKYDGYHFSYKSDNIYNPFSLVNAFEDGSFGDYWFNTGTPTFLVKMLKDMYIDAASYTNGIEVDGSTFESYHIDTTSPDPLLYQAGYLTIKDYDKSLSLYTLAFPNDEVEYGFLKKLMPFYIQTQIPSKTPSVQSFVRDIRSGNVDSFMQRIQSIFEALPPKKSEKFYELDGQQIFFLIFRLMGQFAQCEVQNAKGRTDLVVWTAEIIYVFEFKLDGTADEALAQIDEKNYAVPYQADGRKIVKIGAVFSSEKCNVTEWKISCCVKI